MADKRLLPIKVVFRQDGDSRPRRPTPVDNEPIGEVTQALRNQLADRVEVIQQHFAETFDRWPGLPAVAKVTLKEAAIAKYRRPSYLFNTQTCPIIGGGRPGELFASVQPNGLRELSRRIRSSNSTSAEVNVSVLQSIDPYTTDDAIDAGTVTELLQYVRKWPARPLKFKLFRHHSAAANTALQVGLLRFIRELQVGEIEPLAYAPDMSVYALHDVQPKAVISLASFVGTQSLSSFPNYRVVRTSARAVDNVSATNFPPPDPTRDYGVVGVIDSGTDVTNRHMQAWVIDRYAHHPHSQQDNAHGSFVAGMIIHPRLLNHGDAAFPNVSSRIVDVVAFDKTGLIDEYDLRTVIEDALRRYPMVKIWNMSLAMDGQPCRDDEFSDFGAFIDAMSREHGVLFHLPAGNYSTSPDAIMAPAGRFG